MIFCLLPSCTRRFADTDDGHFAFSFASVRVADGKLYHPDGAWDLETVYVTVYSKRKLIILSGSPQKALCFLFE